MAAVTSAGAVTSPAGEGPVYLGYDFGTSGARVVAIDSAGRELYDAKQPYQVPGYQGLQAIRCQVTGTRATRATRDHICSAYSRASCPF